MVKMKAWYGLIQIGMHFLPCSYVCGGHWRLLWTGPTINIASKPLQTWTKFTLKASMVKMKAWYSLIQIGMHFLPCTVCVTECDNLQPHVIETESFLILMIFDSFSSQTWAIFVPNRNFDQKSMQCSTKSSKVRCQNQEYFKFHDFTRKQMAKIRLNEFQT